MLYNLYKYQRIVAAVIVAVGVIITGFFVRFGVKTPQFATTIYEVSCDLPAYALVSDCVRERTVYSFQPVSILTVNPPANARTRMAVSKGMVWQPNMYVDTLPPGVYVATEVSHEPTGGEAFVQASSYGGGNVYIKGVCETLDQNCLLRVQEVQVVSDNETLTYKEGDEGLVEIVASVYGEASLMKVGESEEEAEQDNQQGQSTPEKTEQGGQQAPAETDQEASEGQGG